MVCMVYECKWAAHACMQLGAGVDVAAETAADILPAAAALYVLRMTL